MHVFWNDAFAKKAFFKCWAILLRKREKEGIH